MILELCGSHHFLSDYECDDCNNKFSKYERVFCQFMLSTTPFFCVGGKKGVSTYQWDRNGTASISFENVVANIKSQVKEEPIVKIMKKDNKFEVTGIQRQYSG